MSRQKTYKQWLVLDWKSGDSRTRKNKPSSSELKANELLAELKVDVEVPEVEVPTLAVQIDVPEPQVFQATMEALDDEDLPDWSDAAAEAIQDYDGDLPAISDHDELEAVVERLTTKAMMNAPGRPPVEQVRDFVSDQVYAMADDGVADA